MEEKLRLKVETDAGERILTMEDRSLKFKEFKMKIKEYLMEVFGKSVDNIQCRTSEGYICINRVSLGDVLNNDDVVYIKYLSVSSKKTKNAEKRKLNYGGTASAMESSHSRLRNETSPVHDKSFSPRFKDENNLRSDTEVTSNVHKGRENNSAYIQQEISRDKETHANSPKKATASKRSGDLADVCGGIKGKYEQKSRENKRTATLGIFSAGIESSKTDKAGVLASIEVENCISGKDVEKSTGRDLGSSSLVRSVIPANPTCDDSNTSSQLNTLNIPTLSSGESSPQLSKGKDPEHLKSDIEEPQITEERSEFRFSPFRASKNNYVGIESDAGFCFQQPNSEFTNEMSKESSTSREDREYNGPRPTNLSGKLNSKSLRKTKKDENKENSTSHDIFVPLESIKKKDPGDLDLDGIF